VVSDFEIGRLTEVLEVLGFDADDGEREELVTAAVQ